MKRSVFVDISSSLFIIMFLYTGISKFLDQATFRWALSKVPFLMHYKSSVGIGIPMLEILIALSLLIPLFKEYNRLRNWGLIASFLLMAIFALYIGYMLKYEPHLPCSCGGIIQQMNWHQHLYFNSIFALLALAAFIFNKKIIRSNSVVSFAG